MQSELTKEQEFFENELQDKRKIVVADAVANVVEAKSSFLKSEGDMKQVEKVVKDAHEVAGILSKHQSHVAKQFHAVHHDTCTLITQRKTRCTNDEQLECETRILHHLTSVVT